MQLYEVCRKRPGTRDTGSGSRKVFPHSTWSVQNTLSIVMTRETKLVRSGFFSDLCKYDAFTGDSYDLGLAF